MVEASASFRRNDEEVLPIQTFLLSEGESVNVHLKAAGRIIRGMIHFAELDEGESAVHAEGFEVRPVNDMYGNPMGHPHTVRFDQLIGAKPEVVIF